MSDEQQHADFEIDDNLEGVTPNGGGTFGPALPPGRYVFDIVDMQAKTANTGKPMFAVTFEVVSEGEHKGVKIVNNYMRDNTDFFRGRRASLAAACGARLDKARRGDYVGCRIEADVVHSEGKQQLGPDGNPKCGADGVPYPPSVFANIANEAKYGDAPAVEPEPTKQPPVANKAAGNSKPAGAAQRRA